jgi:hypothetical protein
MNTDGGQLDRFDARWRFDCTRRRIRQLESRELMGERVVREVPARPGESEVAPDSPAWRPIFARVCGTGA